MEINVDKLIEKECENQDFKMEWEAMQIERKLIDEYIDLRKQNGITKKKLAKITGYKKRKISEMERKQKSPTIKMFSAMLNALGYELKIVKKEYPNRDTKEAISEVQRMKADKSFGKAYTDVDDMMRDILE